MNAVTVRPLRPEDHEAVAELTLASYLDGGHIDPDDGYRHVLADVASRAEQAEVLVAEVRDENGTHVAGSVVLSPFGTPMAETSVAGEYEFRMLAVHPNFHRRGVAAALMDEVERRARAEGNEAIALTTMTSMTDAHRLYERRGFVRVPERDWMLRDILPDLPPEQEKGPFIVYRLKLR
ncbi:MAG: GNAT family N-acetyltransferase [Micrococcus sp.]|nr:GNAT family N-acetyltransferase [Micrococcus sp.]